jgi:lysophospholipase L1-like esterase
MTNPPIVARRMAGRPLLWFALGAAVVATTGCAAWRIRDAAHLARISEPYQATPQAPVASLLVVGDSTAVGTGASTPQHSLAGLIGRGNQKLRIVNRATDGAKYEDFARQLAQSDERFDFVLVLGGGNDVIRFTGADKLRADVQRTAELARERGRTVVLMPPGNVGNAPFFWPPLSWLMTQRSQSLHAAVREVADSVGARYVNLYKPKAQDPFAQRPAQLHARDGLHPSDAGYEEWLHELDKQAALRAQMGWLAQKAEVGPAATASARP